MTGDLRQIPVADVRAFTEEAREMVVAAYQALVRGEDNAQVRLDRAVLDAIDAEINAATLRDVKESLTQDRLPSN